MNGTFDVAEAEPKPDFWYALPHGYRRIDLHPTAEGLAEVARQINELPDEFRDRADQVFRLYAAVVTMMRKQQVQGCALGMHPDGQGGAALSVLTVAGVPMPGVNPKLVLTKLLEAGGAGTTPDEGIRPVELPSGTGFLTERREKAVAPGGPPQDQEGSREETVWRAMAAIPDTGSSSVVTVQLVTPSVELAHDYRGVLLGIAHTVTFTDPAEAAAEQASGTEAPGSVAEAIRDIFG